MASESASRHPVSEPVGPPAVGWLTGRGIPQAVLWLLLALVLFVLAWGNALDAGFQFDDFTGPAHRAAYTSFSGWWAAQPSIRPLLKLSFVLDAALGGEVWRYHLSNLLVHAGNSVLLFMLLRRLAFAVPAAVLAALLFAVHPVATEAVTYVSGRSVSLMAVFFLAGLLLHLEGRRWLALLALGLALAVRETALVFPLALWLLLRYQATRQTVSASLAGGSAAAPTNGPAAWRAVAPYLLVALASLFLLAAVAHYRELFGFSLRLRNPLDNLVTQSAGWLYLASRMLRIDQLNADPVLPVFQAGAGLDAFWGLCIALWACVFAFAFYRRKSWPGLWFGVLWFALLLAPSNSLLPRLDVANERHLYLAVVPIYVALGAGLARWPRLGGALALALLLALAFTTRQRNTVYANETAFWQDVLRNSPGNARAWNNLGYAHQQAGDASQAVECYTRALQLDARLFQARANWQRLCAAQAVRCPP